MKIFANRYILKEDLNHILFQTEGLWEEIRNGRLFITGGTGFFGKWLLESFAQANKRFSLNVSIVVLTRDYERFKKAYPHLAEDTSIEFCIGNVKNFKFPKGEFSHIIHAAATSAVDTFNGEDPLSKFDNVVNGTRRVLDFAVKCGAKKLILTGSGAVYGKHLNGIVNISEEYFGSQNFSDVKSSWGISKGTAEFLCACYSKKYGIETKIARCFSFVGPYLQLDIHYAVGNFIKNGLDGGPIMVKGDGTPTRSYLYAADLTIWLWTILFKGKSCYPYNVGSEETVTVSQLAEIVAENFEIIFNKNIKVEIQNQPSFTKTADNYVPSTKRAQTELGLKQIICLKDAINRTIKFYCGNNI